MDVAPNPRAQRFALAALALCMLLSSLGTGSANVALPAMARSLDASFAQVQWVVLAYLLAVTALIAAVGKLGDACGRRRVLLAGIAIYTLASGLCGISTSLWPLVAARALQGLGGAIMMALAMAMVGDSVPKARAGRAMGLLGTMSAIGTAVGPSIGGLLLARLGWPAIFLPNVPIGLLALLLAFASLPLDRRASESRVPKLDVPGTLLLALILASYALAVTRGANGLGWVNALLLGVSAVGIALFLRIERQAAAPLIRLSMFRDARLSAGLVMSAVVSTVMMATLVVGPFYLARALGLGAAAVGLALSAGPVVVALASMPAGRLADRYGAYAITVAGLVGMMLGCAMLAMLPATLGIAGYLGPIIVVTLGYSLFQTANNTSVMADVAPGDRGSVAGLLSLSRNLGLVTGASLMGTVFALASGSADVASALPGDVAAGMRIAFAVASAMIALALVVARCKNNPTGISDPGLQGCCDVVNR